MTKSHVPTSIELTSLLKSYQNREYEDAERLAKSLSQKYPKHAFAWKILGVIEKQRGNLLEALNINQKIVMLASSDFEAYFNLGNTLKELGRLEDAWISYKKAINLKPDFVEAHNNLGNTLRALGKFGEAELSYKKAIALKPSYSEAHNNLGNSLKELGKPLEAEVCYKKAIEFNNNYVEAYFNLGNTLKELGKPFEAEVYYKKAIELKSDYIEAYFNLGNLLKESGNLVESEISYKKAISLNPNFAEAHNNLGAALKELGRIDEAEDRFLTAIKIKPDYAEAYSNLGNIYRDAGSINAAIINYKKAVNIDPQNQYLRHLLAAITGDSPSRATDSYVATMFDDYAVKFESSLINQLNYQMPKVIFKQLKKFAHVDDKKFDILDLGCGTGLAGLELIGIAKSLVGVDLSENMLTEAKRKNIYSKLIKDEISRMLEIEPRNSFDIVVSSDVFVYIGDLEKTFKYIYDILRTGGLFSYSVEGLFSSTLDGEKDLPNFKLNMTARYSHSLRYLNELCESSKFTLLDQRVEAIRTDKGEPIMGYVTLLSKN